jgi:hypothetical protein
VTGLLILLSLALEGVYCPIYLAILRVDRTFPPDMRVVYDARARLRFGIVAVIIPLVVVALSCFGLVFGELVAWYRSRSRCVKRHANAESSRREEDR